MQRKTANCPEWISNRIIQNYFIMLFLVGTHSVFGVRCRGLSLLGFEYSVALSSSIVWLTILPAFLPRSPPPPSRTPNSHYCAIIVSQTNQLISRSIMLFLATCVTSELEWIFLFLLFTNILQCSCLWSRAYHLIRRGKIPWSYLMKSKITIKCLWNKIRTYKASEWYEWHTYQHNSVLISHLWIYLLRRRLILYDLCICHNSILRSTR